jgi:Tfp pilus assembly protein PilN
LIKINLVREGRAVRGAGAAPAAVAVGGPSNLNTMLIVALLAVGLVIGGGWWVIEKNTLSGRREEVASKTREAQRLESIIKEVEEYQRRKDSLQKRIDLINQLKQNQKGPVKIMDRVSQDLPDLVWLDRMSMSGGLITITGRGLNPNAIANFVEAIKKDPLFEEPDLSAMNQVTINPPVYNFDMTFHFTYAPKGEAGAPGAATGTGTGTTGATSTTGSATKR